MKSYLSGLFLGVLAMTACKKGKEPLNGGSTPVEFVKTEYSFIGTFDAQGRPNYLVEKDKISTELTKFVNGKIPERTDIRTTFPEYLKNADMSITAKSDVYITFLAEGSGYKNTVGYYLYKTGSSPTRPETLKNVIYIFPHAQWNDTGTLKSGDKVKLGTIEAGMSIGFVLIQNAWDNATQSINTKAPHFCSNKELNPENLAELKSHTVLFEYPAENKTIIGFEDINRTLKECDHDFNDVVIYATVKPV